MGGLAISFPFLLGWGSGPVRALRFREGPSGGGGMKSNNGCEESVFFLTQAKNMSNGNSDKTLGWHEAWNPDWFMTDIYSLYGLWNLMKDSPQKKLVRISSQMYINVKRQGHCHPKWRKSKPWIPTNRLDAWKKHHFPKWWFCLLMTY